MSGNVFLVDEDYRVWMMNGETIEEWYYCPECGHEGFKEDMEHSGNNGCYDYQKSIGLTEECEEHYTEFLPSEGCEDCNELKDEGITFTRVN